MKLRCRLGLHKWSNWTTHRVRWIDQGYTGWEQTKQCQLCGKRVDGTYA